MILVSCCRLPCRCIPGAITHAREAKLKQNLATLNEVIEKYSLDKGHAPQSL
jgi:hypothetical protein